MQRSHKLPLYQTLFPEYSANLVRVARRVYERYPSMTLIDIGANVGDTAALLRTCARFPILCIEGAAEFFEILERNLPALGGDVEVDQTFIGSHLGTMAATLVSSGGTARLEQGEPGAEPVRFERIGDVLERHSRFRDAKFLKIDTDGYDVHILRGDLAWLERNRPVIFFEYDPRLLSSTGTERPWSVFPELAERGYEIALAFENTGEYRGAFHCSAEGAAKALHDAYASWGASRYADIGVFHREDGSLAQLIRADEERSSQRGA